ncbi:hypothetical protein [Gordonia sp. NB41Y]|uniref:hypothetical protein n=1 Tax=Gordonia sp. NB41Y TaxID=875808 RepID=UPI0002BD4EBC|nr:hypothetical protein [Gordonia sp. NB41Y]EMP14024.1 hypothetical protein ISGA_4000 [Gordonia sp. NB41Y]WLP91317.1 hypothetical protein Q9K23_03335 [Gordonia sp. NB41Y]
MPSNKKSSKAAAEPDMDSTAASAAPQTESSSTDDTARLDLMDSLQVGSPSLAPVPVTFRGIDFEINRYYPPEVIWEWSDLQRTIPDDPKGIEESNRKLLAIIIPAECHDKIDELLAAIADRSIPEARRVYAFMNQTAGLTDRAGNPLAL